MQAISENPLFKPLKISDKLTINNRIAMAPLTRQRAELDGVPNDLLVEYYSQRASFGVILTECSPVDQVGNGFEGCGGIYNQQQIEGWKRVTDAVHQKGGKIIMQIWHAGRAALSSINGGSKPISASELAIKGIHIKQVPYEKPRQLSVEEIKEVIQQYVRGAQYALEAGFDGVQLHGANGYLIDQFLKESSNERTDQYGGSIENRCRFVLELIDEVIKVLPSSQDLSIRLSPTGRFQDQYDSNPIALMEYLLPELEKKNIGFVELKRHNMLERKGGMMNPNNKTPQGVEKAKPEEQIPDFFRTLRKFYKGLLMGNDGLSPQYARELLEDGTIDMASFGTLAIHNPDLPERILHNYPLNTDKQIQLYYQGKEEGYTTFKRYEEENKAKI